MGNMDTEKEQLAQIKRWVHENGLSIVIGIIVGLGGVYGWKAWQQHRIADSQKISGNLYGIIRALDGTRPDAAEAAAKSLLSGMSDDLYTDMTRLLLARSYVEQGELQNAVQPLMKIIERGEASTLEPVARIRLARVYIEASKFDEAKALLTEPPPTAYAALYEEVRGDIHHAQGNIQRAGELYLKAERLIDGGVNAEILRMKIDGLSLHSERVAQADTTVE